MKLTFGEVYNIQKYYNVDIGIKEVKPELLQEPKVLHACQQIKLYTEYLEEYLKENEIDEGEDYED